MLSQGRFAAFLNAKRKSAQELLEGSPALRFTKTNLRRYLKNQISPSRTGKLQAQASGVALLADERLHGNWKPVCRRTDEETPAGRPLGNALCNFTG
ncbi:hypothetical protein KCP71_25585 [Salmonella enterica subsp. enterica]|nr:hypothetical protein KCP71_25585 [Salmonella enterica subsp. enterica]